MNTRKSSEENRNIVSLLGRKRGYKKSHRNSGQVDQNINMKAIRMGFKKISFS